MLSKLAAAKYRDGQKLTDDEIVAMLIATLFAGQHTSSTVSSWTILFLLDEHRKKQRAEAARVDGGGEGKGGGESTTEDGSAVQYGAARCA